MDTLSRSSLMMECDCSALLWFLCFIASWRKQIESPYPSLTRGQHDYWQECGSLCVTCFSSSIDVAWKSGYPISYEKKSGITGTAWRCINPWLSYGRRIRCISNAFASIWQPHFGMVSHKALWPLLFLMFINQVASYSSPHNVIKTAVVTYFKGDTFMIDKATPSQSYDSCATLKMRLRWFLALNARCYAASQQAMDGASCVTLKMRLRYFLALDARRFVASSESKFVNIDWWIHISLPWECGSWPIASIQQATTVSVKLGAAIER